MPRVYHSGVISYLFMLLDSKADLSIFVVYNGNMCRLIECQFCVHSMIPYVSYIFLLQTHCSWIQF